MRLLLPWLAIVAVACGGSPDESEPAGTTFEAINADVFVPRCTNACHSGGPDIAAGGLDLRDDPGTSLIDHPATASVCKGMGMKRVVPGHPESSLLYLKILSKIDGSEAPCGDGMPSGVQVEPLSSEEAERVRAWIAESSRRDD